MKINTFTIVSTVGIEFNTDLITTSSDTNIPVYHRHVSLLICQ